MVRMVLVIRGPGSRSAKRLTVDPLAISVKRLPRICIKLSPFIATTISRSSVA